MKNRYAHEELELFVAVTKAGPVMDGNKVAVFSNYATAKNVGRTVIRGCKCKNKSLKIERCILVFKE